MTTTSIRLPSTPRLGSTKRWFVDHTYIGSLALFGTHLAFVTAQTRTGDEPNEIDIIDMTSGTRMAAARTSFAGGVIDWVEGTGNTMVWYDENRFPDDAHPDVRWHIDSEDLETHVHRVLASGAGPYLETPLPHVRDGIAVWTQGTSARRDLLVADLETGTTRTVQRGTAVGGVDVVTSHTLVADEPSDPDHHKLVLIDVATGAQTSFVDAPEAHEPRSSAGWVTWDERPPPPRTSDDPTSVWIAPADRSAPPVALSTEPNQGNEVCGAGWAVWYAAGTIVDFGVIGQPAIAVSQSRDVAPRIASDGMSFAYAVPIDVNAPEKGDQVIVQTVSSSG